LEWLKVKALVQIPVLDKKRKKEMKVVEHDGACL
jgi:hypothetical protein